jgi:hypothetical protein
VGDSSLSRSYTAAGAEAVDEGPNGMPVMFPEGSADPRGADICLYTAKVHKTSASSMPSQPQGLLLTSELLQEFLVWVVAFSALLGVLVILVSRQRKKVQQRAFADSLLAQREGGSHFDSDIIREHKERYYAREKGLQAALQRSRVEHEDSDD